MAQIAHPFVSWEIPDLDTLKESRAYRLRALLNAGIKLNRDQKNWLTEAVNSNAYSKHGVPVMGWMFNFRDVLRRFFVKQYGHVQEYYATDKTALRSYICGSIDEIVELPN